MSLGHRAIGEAPLAALPQAPAGGAVDADAVMVMAWVAAQAAGGSAPYASSAAVAVDVALLVPTRAGVARDGGAPLHVLGGGLSASSLSLGHGAHVGREAVHGLAWSLRAQSSVAMALAAGALGVGEQRAALAWLLGGVADGRLPLGLWLRAASVTSIQASLRARSVVFRLVAREMGLEPLARAVLVGAPRRRVDLVLRRRGVRIH